MGDDLIPNQGGTDYFDVPEERQEEESRAAGIIASSYPILADTYDWFQSQVAMCDHITNIDLLHPTYSPKEQMMAYQMLHSLLEQKMVEFSEFKDER